jgi:1-acyl-sn-glycerol-3-phosphate acyltransferase
MQRIIWPCIDRQKQLSFWVMNSGPNLKRRVRSLRGFFLRLLISLRYRLEVRGLGAIPADTAMLFLPNHPALLDPFLVYSCLDGLRPRFLADENQFGSALLRWVKAVARVITIPDYNVSGPAARAGVLQGLDEAAGALRAGDSLLLYPAGSMQRETRELVRNTSSVSRILQAAPEARVIGVRIEGMWGSSFSRAFQGGKKPDFMLALKRGIKIILRNGIFFTPRRHVRISFTEAKDFPRPASGAGVNAAGRKTVTAWLNDFYASALHEPKFVPYYFWQKRPHLDGAAHDHKIKA